MNSSYVSGEPYALPYKFDARDGGVSSGGGDGLMLGWNVPPEHMDMVHPHWRAFPNIPEMWHLMLGAIYFILMIVSTLGNGIVIYLFFTTKSLRTPSNLFISNQAVLDLFMMLNMPHLVINAFYKRMTGWEDGCDLFGLLGSISGIGSAMNNAMIAYDRYRTIAFPLDGRLGMGKTVIIVAFVWLYSMPFSILPLLRIGSKYAPEGFLTTCSFDYLTETEEVRYFMLAIFIWSYVMPMMCIIVFYSQLLGHVRQHEKMLRDQAKKMNVKSLQSNQDAQQKSVEIRIAKVAMTIVFLFICSWTPYAIVALVGAFGDRTVLTPIASMIPAVSAKIVSCIDPWIYAINHPKFRAEMQKQFPCLAPKDDSPSETVSVATENTNAKEENA
ncbi:unnamed protein product [Bemisia tabaci]|uniref:G-protein coupled receptors family 1 profile domain-containing protein n=1 Tax=Bemisia tabaci TaxID=7038 RepID=A0A9P0A4N3_BEMTA|nr:PREDICTED: opsin-2 [Bemisia tabaci]CAH0385630.1 unnamed protein product [Bemisia tabaci]